MDRFLRSVFFCILIAGQDAARSNQAAPVLTPDEVWKINAGREATFLNVLKIVDEPSLLERSRDKTVESYRFSWIISGGRPMCVRLDVLADRSGVLITKHWRNSASAGGGSPVSSEVRVPKEEVVSFVASVRKLGLWGLPYAESLPKGVYILDGVSWVFEEVSQGNYHVIVRLSPRDGPMFELGNGMMNWSKRIQ